MKCGLTLLPVSPRENVKNILVHLGRVCVQLWLWQEGAGFIGSLETAQLFSETKQTNSSTGSPGENQNKPALPFPKA